MMLSELSRKDFGDDTRVFLSLDRNDKAVLEGLLAAALAEGDAAMGIPPEEIAREAIAIIRQDWPNVELLRRLKP